MSFGYKAPTFLSLASSILLLIGCSSEQEKQAKARAREAADASSLALYSALENSDQDLALGILKIKAAQSDFDEVGRTPLMVAARTSSTPVSYTHLTLPTIYTV